MKRYIIIVMVTTMLLIVTPLITSCAEKPAEGVLPTLSIGDKWVWKVTVQGAELTEQIEVTGEDVTDGENCYVMQGTADILARVTKVDKTTMQMVSEQWSYEYGTWVTTLSYEFPEVLPFPLVVGKEYREVVTVTTNFTSNRPSIGSLKTYTTKSTYIRKVEGIERITVPAGTFRCFKIVTYDEGGYLLDTSWYSDKAKRNVKNVKTTDKSGDTTGELLSYSVH